MGAVPDLGALSNRSKEPWDHARKDIAQREKDRRRRAEMPLEEDQNEK